MAIYAVRKLLLALLRKVASVGVQQEDSVSVRRAVFQYLPDAIYDLGKALVIYPRRFTPPQFSLASTRRSPAR